jgi:hypothetical protein
VANVLFLDTLTRTRSGELQPTETEPKFLISATSTVGAAGSILHSITPPTAPEEKSEPVTVTGEAKLSPEAGETVRAQVGRTQPDVPDVPAAPEGPAITSTVANSIAPATRAAKPAHSNRRRRMANRITVPPAIDI